MTPAEIAGTRTILRALVGSTAHGLGVSDGVDDRDEMGVCIEPMEYAIGFSRFETYIYRTAAEREGKPDAKSRAGDLDLVIYSLRKYLGLALKGNPTVLMLLFSPPEHCEVRGDELQGLAPLIVSRKVAGPFLGYLTAQKQRLIGERGQKRTHRPELVEKYGFDTKYAMHMLRLGYQGVEVLSTGRMSLPMRESERKFLLDVRTGQVPLGDCLERARQLEQALTELRETSPLRESPDVDAVEDWMVRTYKKAWDHPYCLRCIACGGDIEDTPRMIAACDKCLREDPGLGGPP
jgi:predicted nucleotidyltransferase